MTKKRRGGFYTAEIFQGTEQKNIRVKGEKRLFFWLSSEGKSREYQGQEVGSNRL